MHNKGLYALSNLIAVVCAMRYWQFNIPPRIFIFDVLCAAFIIVFVINMIIRNNAYHLPKELKIFLLYKWAFIFCIVISGIQVIVLSSSEESFSQYFINVISETYHTFFFMTLVYYLSSINITRRKSILNSFILGVILSSIYGIIDLTLWKMFGLRFGSYIWNQISYNPDLSFDIAPTWAVKGIIRGSGFPGVNASATYSVTILPLLIVGYYKRKLFNLTAVGLVLIGMIITMSRTGVVSLIASLFFLFLTLRSKMIGSLKTLVLALIPVLGLGYKWFEYINEILKYRTHMDYSRFELWKGGLQLFLHNPLLGTGAGNYSIARSSLSQFMYTVENLHNSWLQILVELGVVGFTIIVLYYVFIIKTVLNIKGPNSYIYIATLLGLFVGGLFNQFFDLFYYQYYVCLLFAIITLDNREHVSVNKVL